MYALSQLDEITGQRVDGAAIGVARIFLGSAALLLALEEAATLTRMLSGPKLRLPYSTLVPTVPADQIVLFFLVWSAIALMLIAGWHARLAGALLTVTLAYTLLIDQQTYSNHLYLTLLAIFLLTLANPGAQYAVDARRGRTQPTVPYWPVLLMKLQLSIVYFFAAIAKINADYLSGSMLEMNLNEGALLRLPQTWLRGEVLAPLAIASIALELFLAFGFWLPRLRQPALLLGVGFHLAIIALFPAGMALELAAFSLTMFALYAPFFDLAAIRSRTASFLRRTPMRPEVPAQG